MPVAPTYAGATPTVGADEDDWGGELNTGALAPIAADLAAICALLNSTETAAAAALPKAGGDMTGDLGLGDPTPDDASSAGFRGLPTVSIDVDRTFVAKDAGKCIRLTGTTARTWTIPPDILPIGQAIVLRSFSTASLSIARGAGVSLRTALSATDGNKSLASYGYATLYQEALNVWLVSGTGVA